MNRIHIIPTFFPQPFYGVNIRKTKCGASEERDGERDFHETGTPRGEKEALLVFE